jgi:uncharacterized protein
MQTQPLPILIFAQSGRFLAQSATQAGYTVWVADCFGDVDLVNVADRWQSLPAFSELTHDRIFTELSELTKGEQCLLICGSGIEQCYHLLLPLPPNIKLIGNTPDTIQPIKTPTLFFKLLNDNAINYPETRFKAAFNKLYDGTWLKKAASGLGGSHIQYAVLNTNDIDDKYYYQRFIAGISGSCLFLADGRDAQLININQQHLSPNRHAPFRLGRIESAWQLSAAHNDQLQKIIKQLIAATGLIGLNSLDFVISDNNELLTLEINPRISASAELISHSAVLFQQHLDVCLGQYLTSEIPINADSASLFYHYATTDLIVPQNMKWPAECHDIPAAEIVIKQDEPICISVVEVNKNQLATQQHIVIEEKILSQLQPY